MERGPVAIGDSYYDPSVALDSNTDLVVEGSVGIGTANPVNAKLQVQGDINLPQGQSLWIKDGGPGDSGNRLRVHGRNGNGYIDTQNSLYFRFGDSSATTTMLLDNTGGVTIGGGRRTHWPVFTVRYREGYDGTLFCCARGEKLISFYGHPANEPTSLDDMGIFVIERSEGCIRAREGFYNDVALHLWLTCLNE